MSENYWKSEQKCRKLTTTIASYIHLEQLIHFAVFLSSIHNIWIGNFDTSTWNLIYNTVVPFDTQKIWCWYILAFIQCNMAFTYSACQIAPTVYFVCCCIYICAICEHIDLLMQSITRNADDYQNARDPSKKKELHEKIKRTLCQVMEVHVKLFE